MYGRISITKNVRSYHYTTNASPTIIVHELLSFESCLHVSVVRGVGIVVANVLLGSNPTQVGKLYIQLAAAPNKECGKLLLDSLLLRSCGVI